MTSLQTRFRGRSALMSLAPLALSAGLALLLSRAVIADGRRGTPVVSPAGTDTTAPPVSGNRGDEAAQRSRPSWGWDSSGWW